MPLALDTYFRGNSHELEFCKSARAGGNHLVACTASGQILASGHNLKLRERELASVLKEFATLPEDQRRPELPDSAQATPARREVPDPPENGLIIRGYCTYLHRAKDGENAGQIDRATRFYYEQNPDRWAVETQSDMLWLTESEWKSLVPAEPTVGETMDVADTIQQRFFSTIGIDYMEGSVNALPTRGSTMTLTIEKVTDDAISVRLNGSATLGKPFSEDTKSQARTRGSELNVLGYLHYNRRSNKFEQFQVVGVGEAWGNKMEYIRREVGNKDYPWLYGIACEMVDGDTPMERIPPYNLLHYNSVGKYFSAE